MNDYGNIYDYECLWLWWLSWLFKGFMIYHMNDYEWLWWYIYIYMEPKKELNVLRWYMFLIIIIFDRFMFEL